MTSAPLPPLADPPALAARLQMAPPTDPIVLASWETALADASGQVRDAVGQPLTPATSTLDVEVNCYGQGIIPLCPVQQVVTVLDPNGVTLPGDGTGYQLTGQRLMIWARYLVVNPHSRAVDPVYAVTVDHGWDPIPGELLRWVFALAAAQIASSAVGNLGIPGGGITSVAVDDGRVNFSDTAAAIAIPDKQIARLRAMYGGEA